MQTIERLSLTFTANGKNETFAVSLQLCVQWSEIICICNKVGNVIPFLCGLEEKNSKAEVIIFQEVKHGVNGRRHYFCF